MRHIILGSLLLLPLQGFAGAITAGGPQLVEHTSLSDWGAVPWQPTLGVFTRPQDMGTPWGMLHLGTNTDVFAVATGPVSAPFRPSDFWVRYQLDPSSNSASTDESCGGCGGLSPTFFSGEVWLEFKRESSGYQIEMWTYLQQPTQTTGNWMEWWPSFSTSQLPPGQTGVQTLPNAFSVPQPEGSFMARFNLAFLELNWNNGAYELATSLIGFDNLYHVAYDYPFYSTTMDFNIAPVPLPAAAWLFGVGLGALGLARRR